MRQTEELVNKEISASLPVETDIMTLDEAKKTGAMALFDEKYGEKVRVVSMGDFSKELCGGTHVRNTAEIQNFKILSESGISAGVRRIEALTGDAVMEYYRQTEAELIRAAAMLKTNPAGLPGKIAQLQAELKRRSPRSSPLRARLAKDALGDVSGSGAGDQRCKAPLQEPEGC